MAVAEDIDVVGHIDQPIINDQNSYLLNDLALAVKQVTLLKVELSEHALEKLDERAHDILSAHETLSIPDVYKPFGKKQLGMDLVPVLDQGEHGACVVFAITAAVDAALNKGDYLSQLCPLQLGRYLEHNAYIHSGWNGSTGGVVLNQLRLFGLVSKEQQKAVGCGGLTDYPLKGGDEPGLEMTLLDYHQISEPMQRNVVGWSDILDIYHVFLDKTDMKVVVTQIKTALDAGDRVVFGTLLPAIDQGVVGAVGRYHSAYDSWILTADIIQEMKSEKDFAAHELIITGYDNNAVAMDKKGYKHKGLFTLRNSWGDQIGDQGNFYMSYDYFKALAIEAIRIRHIQ